MDNLKFHGGVLEMLPDSYIRATIKIKDKISTALFTLITLRGTEVQVRKLMSNLATAYSVFRDKGSHYVAAEPPSEDNMFMSQPLIMLIKFWETTPELQATWLGMETTTLVRFTTGVLPLFHTRSILNLLLAERVMPLGLASKAWPHL
ncbi:hypothetical protein G4B88_012874 [Cannabis sativa]|uniref:Uncharacterized protein n=1 Tax=Cannabis sativa TaxID=3483 RepID=A0A7J6F7I0_CANSA|nr:hypothetical protein G4B88_012874 [Cannabis sativa]